MIRRLQPGYKPVGALHANEDTKPRIRYCQRCEDLFQIQARLGPKIMMPGVPKPSDHDLWLECRNCGSLFQRHEVKVEPELEPIKEPSDGKQPKCQVIETKKKRRGRGSNPRLKGNKWEIKDEELKAELKSGSVLLSVLVDRSNGIDSTIRFTTLAFSPLPSDICKIVPKIGQVGED